MGDTLDALAQQAGISTGDLQKANCMTGTGLLPGTILYLPKNSASATPTATLPPTETPTLAGAIPVCGPPQGWVLYTVQRYDTLYGLSQVYGISINALMAANCMTSTTLIVRTQIYVPYIPTPTNTATIRPNSILLPTQAAPSASLTAPNLTPATATPTLESTPTPSASPSPEATQASPTPTLEASPTREASPTLTVLQVTSTPTPPPTSTDEPTSAP